MRLLTHNFMQSTVKNVTSGYPLKIEAEEISEEMTDCNPKMITNVLQKLDWGAVLYAHSVVVASFDPPLEELPELKPCGESLTEELIESLHRLLMCIHVVTGTLVCPETNRPFPIKDGIPNMILHEDEL